MAKILSLMTSLAEKLPSKKRAPAMKRGLDKTFTDSTKTSRAVYETSSGKNPGDFQ
jgi:hypothetical protein